MALQKEQPLVSVIVACYNGEQYIDQCFEALIHQTYSNIEILVCDDASTDDSLNKLQQWAEKDSRVKVLHNAFNLFAAASRNRCFKEAKGDYFCIQDVDDISLPNRIERLLEVIQSEDVDFVSSPMQCFDGSLNNLTEVIECKKEYPNKKDFLRNIAFCHPATLFTRECIEQVNGYRVSPDTRRCQDYDMFMRLYAAGYKGKNIKEPLYLYRRDEGNFKRGQTYVTAKCAYKVRKYGFKQMNIPPPSSLSVEPDPLDRVSLPQDEEPLVTIAIPTYNTEKFLPFAIQSVINQTYKNWELILVDDGSTDDSLKIAQDYSNKDKRIIVMSDGLKKGLPARLNESILVAKGLFYARMDSDDIMAVDRIETQVKMLEQESHINVVGSSAMIIDEQNNIVRSADMSYTGGKFIHPSVMGRTEWFRKYLYNPSFVRSQDVELWLRSNVIFTSINIQKPLLFYREFGVQTLKKNLESHKALRTIYKNYGAYRKTLWWAVKGISYTYIQDCAYMLFNSFGKMDRLMKKRKRTPLPDNICLNQVDLNKSIAATEKV